MCGIVGFIKNQKDEELIESFTNSVSHRGPDFIDYKIIKIGKFYLHLGSARLSLRGDSSENMPMMGKDGNIIVYNGEVFDLKSLKQKLNNNKQYTGDTRMLLDLLSNDEKDINQVNGMFAFAFYSNKFKKLFLGRDKLGIKPLHFVKKNNEEIFFSSEMSSLINFSNTKLDISESSLKQLLLFNGSIQNTTLFNDIKTVQPGQLVSFDILNENKEYLETTTSINSLDYIEDYSDFGTLIEEVIEDHLVADSSVDLFLSGGIDSSLLAYITKKKLDKDIRHFSMTFENQSYDEKNLIMRVSDELNLNSKIFTFDNKNINNYVNEAIENMNSLVLDYSFVPTYLLSKKTSQFTKAVISGDGADELFGGYEWYRAVRFFNILPPSLLQIFKKIFNTLLIPSSNGKYMDSFTKLNYFFKYISTDPYIQTIIWQSADKNFSESKVQLISENISQYISNDLSQRDNLRNIDLNIFLYSNVLPKIDTASMKNSLEIRPPFLDERIIKFALSSKKSNEVGFLKTKKYLRNYLEGTNLEFVSNAKKHGFGFPLQEWLKNGGKDEIKEMFLDRNLVYLSKDKKYIKDLIFNSSINESNSRELWAYFVLSKWFDKHSIKVN